MISFDFLKIFFETEVFYFRIVLMSLNFSIFIFLKNILYFYSGDIK